MRATLKYGCHSFVSVVTNVETLDLMIRNQRGACDPSLFVSNSQKYDKIVRCIVLLIKSLLFQSEHRM